MTTEEEIKEFVVENFLFGDARGLQNDSSFLQEGIIDSTGVMQLVAFISERYSIAIDDEEIIPENFDSIDNAAAFIERKTRLVPIGLAIPAAS